MPDSASEPPNITTTARAYAALVCADRVAALDLNGGAWWSALADFASDARVIEWSGEFHELQMKRAKPSGASRAREEQNNFDVAHLADLMVAERYVDRYHSKRKGEWKISGILKRVKKFPDGGGLGAAPAEKLELEVHDNAEGVVVARLIQRLRDAVDDKAGSSGRKEAAPFSKGEVEFETGNRESAHFFATLHALRALHALSGDSVGSETDPGPPSESLLDQDLVSGIVDGARSFCVEQCFYHHRSSHRRDTVRLAFAASIYIIYAEHVDKDLALAAIQALAAAQQSNGSWPATHPIIREKDRAPWHISSHEIALCLTWLYFQPQLPDEARPLLLEMMQRYFDQAVVAAYHGGGPDNEGQKNDPEASGPPQDARGWQDDHTRSHELVVGWANAVVCHYLANYARVLDDWINRRVIR